MVSFKGVFLRLDGDIMKWALGQCQEETGLPAVKGVSYFGQHGICFAGSGPLV